MRITLVFTGKTKSGYLHEGVEEYIGRIGRYVPFNVIIIPDLKNTRKTDPRDVQKKEGELILQKIKSEDYVILLDENGKVYSSEKFATFIAGMEGRTGSCVFVIGGPYGFSEEVYQRANDKLSLSSMTFSHQMVRLIFTEQLYRAYTILNSEPYHHK